MSGHSVLRQVVVQGTRSTKEISRSSRGNQEFSGQGERALGLCKK